MSGTVRWGVIGIGRFGTLHARILGQLPGADLVAVANRNPERLARAVEELGFGGRVHEDYRALLADPEVDAVSITTHWRDHFEVAKAALEAGKHVLLEKPMAATAEECRKLIDAAREAEGFLLVGHVCRFDPRVTLAKEAIDAGRIGRIVSMHAKRNLPVAPGNIRLDKISPLVGDGIHDADLMMWFLDEAPTAIYARNVRVNDFRHPDLGWAMLHFGEKAVGVVETNWGLPANVPTGIDATFEIVGTEGMITIDCAHTGLRVLDGEGLSQPDTVYWPVQHGRHVGALEREISYFQDCITRGAKPEVITPFEAGRALAVMETAERSADEGRVISFEFAEV